MITGRIKAMLEACEAGDPSFPPNVLFNEGWLLRIILDWFERHGGDRYPLSPLPGARWFSEAWLPSAFLPRYRGDRLAESRTHADGVLGHFTIGDPGTAGLNLLPDARQLVVIEGKLFNRLSAGVKNAPYYDQAARSVACIAEVLRRAGREPEAMDDLALPDPRPPGPGRRRRSSPGTPRPTPSAARSAAASRTTPASATPGSATGSSRPCGRIDVRCLSWEDDHRRDRLPQPRGGPAHRQLLRQVPPLQPPPGPRQVPRPPQRRRPAGVGTTELIPPEPGLQRQHPHPTFRRVDHQQSSGGEFRLISLERRPDQWTADHPARPRNGVHSTDRFMPTTVGTLSPSPDLLAYLQPPRRVGQVLVEVGRYPDRGRPARFGLAIHPWPATPRPPRP